MRGAQPHPFHHLRALGERSLWDAARHRDRVLRRRGCGSCRWLRVFRSSNGVALSRGFDGRLPSEYFLKAVLLVRSGGRAPGSLLWGRGEEARSRFPRRRRRASSSADVAFLTWQVAVTSRRLRDAQRRSARFEGDE
eukprot:4199666-Alexandrium_andersonii.AAC.1